MTSTANAAGFNNAFSPTLARLLTAPERNFALSTALASNNGGNNTVTANNNINNNNTFFSNQTAGINLSKSSNARSQHQQQDSSKPEISCLPISQILAFQQQQQQQQPQNNSLLQQQLQRYQRDINKFLPKNNALFNLVRTHGETCFFFLSNMYLIRRISHSIGWWSGRQWSFGDWRGTVFKQRNDRWHIWQVERRFAWKRTAGVSRVQKKRSTIRVCRLSASMVLQPRMSGNKTHATFQRKIWF